MKIEQSKQQMLEAITIACEKDFEMDEHLEDIVNYSKPNIFEEISKKVMGHIRKPALALMLAGGLTVENITKAIEVTSIQNFDISSGIEKSPGIKSITKMKEFIKKLND